MCSSDWRSRTNDSSEDLYDGYCAILKGKDNSICKVLESAFFPFLFSVHKCRPASFCTLIEYS